MRKSVEEVRMAVLKFVEENLDFVGDVGSHVLQKSGMDMQQYMQMLRDEKDFAADKLSLFALSKIAMSMLCSRTKLCGHQM